MSPQKLDIIELLHQAQAETVGLLVQTNFPERLVWQLRQCKTQAGLAGLQVRRVDYDGGQVVITRPAPGYRVGPEDLGL